MLCGLAHLAKRAQILESNAAVVRRTQSRVQGQAGPRHDPVCAARWSGTPRSDQRSSRFGERGKIGDQVGQDPYFDGEPGRFHTSVSTTAHGATFGVTAERAAMTRAVAP